jgi:hypothetical protein
MHVRIVSKIIDHLREKRPVFDDEKDFQYSLAHAITAEWPDCVLYLEGRPLREQKDLNYDICVSHEDREFFFELKFKPTNLTASVGSRVFRLKRQSAQDVYCYDFLYDVWKIEQVVLGMRATGYAIFLTNDSLYWRGPRNEPAYFPFRLKDGRRIAKSENLSWLKGKEKKGSGRQQDITLQRSYNLKWHEYSMLDNAEPRVNGRFNYLLLEVNGA